MNIFYVDKSPILSAKMLCDKHVVKMTVESAQILSTVHNLLDGGNPKFYRTTHKNHPCVKWAMSSSGNYRWLYLHFVTLCDEYTFRYGKIHLTDIKMRKALKSLPLNIPKGGFNEPPKCMDMRFQKESTVDSYRNYYILDKSSFAKWTKREIPSWFAS